MNRLHAAVLALPLAIAGCGLTPVQLQAYQDQIAAACSMAMMIHAGPVSPWIIGGCATERAIATLALDPSSLAWVNSLIAMARG